jgi:serine/threonine protein kinase
MEENREIKLIYEEESLNRITNNKLCIDDFLMLNVIGQGSYGKVLLVRKKDDENVYAMKILKKKNMIKRKQVEHVRSERKIMVFPM